MKKSQLKQIIKEEISRALKENKLNPELDEAFLGLLPDVKKGERLEITGSQGVGMLEKVKNANRFTKSRGEYKHFGDTKLFGNTFKSGKIFKYNPGEKIAVGDNYGSFGVIKKLRNASTGEEYKKIKL
tara:strand:+ start:346 stop:729 length:384 start_codon:yes stop_codon:yes gene_type:complete